MDSVSFPGLQQKPLLIFRTKYSKVPFQTSEAEPGGEIFQAS